MPPIVIDSSVQSSSSVSAILTYIDEYGQTQTTVISVIPDNEDFNENPLDSHFSICEVDVLNSDVFINITTDGKIFYY